MDSLGTGTKFFMRLDEIINYAKSGKAIIFDLDNTIYEEKEFLFLAYQEIIKAIYLNTEYDQDKVLRFLINSYNLHGRSSSFSKTLQRYPVKDVNETQFLKVMRDYKPQVPLKKMLWFESFINQLPNFEILVITNGDIQQQKNKVDALNIPNPHYIVYANELVPKPDPSAYKKLEKDRTLVDPIFIGDSNIDKVFARNCGIQFVDVQIITGFK